MPLTRVEFHVLLALQSGASHGYAVMRDVETLTSGEIRIGPGTLYTAIKRLLDASLIEEFKADDDRRRCYRPTKKGKAAAAEEARRLSDLVRIARRRGLLPAS